jgi:hypothetical protein
LNFWNNSDLTREQLATLILRFGLFGSAAGLLTSISLYFGVALAPLTAPVWIQISELLFAFIVLLIAIRNPLPRWTIWLIPTIFLIVTANYVVNDVIQRYQQVWLPLAETHLFADYAAYLLRAGHNPYEFMMSEAFRVLQSSQAMQTQLLRNDLYASLAQSPLSFLILLPFQWLGIPTHYTAIVFLVLSILLIYQKTPLILRPLILLPVFANPTFFIQALRGNFDIVWVFLLLLMILTWRRPNLRALWYGLALALGLQPWLLAPFLLIRLHHEQRDNPALAILRFSAISVGMFLLINLPFIVWNPPAWLDATTSYFLSDFIISGDGLSRPTMMGLIMLPKLAFLVMLSIVFSVSAHLYWRYYEHLRDLIWMLPAFALWFAPHATLNQFIFPAFLLIFALIHEASPPTPIEPVNWRPARNAIIGGAAPVLWLLVAFSLRGSPISIEVVDGVAADIELQVNSLTVVVTNNSDTPLNPRFSMTSRGYTTPAFWAIINGPQTVEPGDSATYQLASPAEVWAIDADEGTQVIVSDAYRYDLRASTVIEGDLSAGYAGVLPNGQYTYWNADSTAPLHWQRVGAGTIEPITIDGVGSGLRLNLPEATETTEAAMRVGTDIMFPYTAIEVWVNPPAGTNIPPDFESVYGLELIANDTRVWVLFGDESSSGEIDDGLYYWMIPAPSETWSKQTLHLREIYAELGFEIDDLSVEYAPRLIHLNYPMTRLTFRLMAATRDPEATSITVEFGPVANTALLPDRGLNVQDALEHPERMLLWRGEQNRIGRNYETAEAYFNQVLAINPDEAYAHIGLGWTYFESGRDSELVTQQFDEARILMNQQPGRYDRADFANFDAINGWLRLREGNCFAAAITFEQVRTTDQNFRIPYDALEQCGALFTTPAGN